MAYLLFFVKMNTNFAKRNLIIERRNDTIKHKIVPTAESCPQHEHAPGGVFHFILKWNNHLQHPLPDPGRAVARIHCFGKVRKE